MCKVKVTIEVPPGYKLVQTGEGKWEQQKIETLSKTWEEFCETHPIQNGEYYIDPSSYIHELGGHVRRKNDDKNVLPNRETAEAFIALMQLIQLRDYYNDGWKPDWTDVSGHKYAIINRRGKLDKTYSITMSYVLTFRTEELRDQFLENFRAIIEMAKPLI